MLVKTYNQKGEEIEQTRLPKEIFEVPMNRDLVHQVLVSQRANQRQGTAHTKGRGEVRGGGRKPWRQKGTGRARHGSIRSPLWKGGGVTFGPTKEKIYENVIPKKMRRKALFMVLSAKAKENFLLILDELKLENPKTREIAVILSKLPYTKSSCLIVLPAMDKNLILAARNLPKTETIQAKDLNVLSVISSKYLVLLKDSLRVIKETFTQEFQKASDFEQKI